MFFRVIVAYYLGMVASQMRVSISGWQKGGIPVNIYAIAASPSGSGKGNSTSFIEQQVIKDFKDNFMYRVLPTCAEVSIKKLSEQQADEENISITDAKAKVTKDYISTGSYLFQFDSATVPAVKQQRAKLLFAQCGALNFQVDEIGSNLVGSTEVLNIFLELYDLGRVKEKLIKNTADNKRISPPDGITPANMLLFGTPSKLMDGDKTEELFLQMLETGYARRCFFAYSKDSGKRYDLTPEDVINNMFYTSSDIATEEIRNRLEELADVDNVGKEVHLGREELRYLITYKLACEKKAINLSEYESIKRTELEHRYFKVMKLAGAYAFIDGTDITKDHLDYAISLAELSGESLSSLLVPEKNYMKLAKFLSQSLIAVTNADLEATLPYYKGSKQQKQEMIDLAIAYGYRAGIVITSEQESGITFYKGEALEETNLQELILSVGNSFSDGYSNFIKPWDKLSSLGSSEGFQWCNHRLEGSHRAEETVVEGFNLITLDVDSGFPIQAARELLEGYSYLIYTTKRHTEEHHRYRIIIPTSHVLYMNKNRYKEFMGSVMESFPFELDKAANQRSKTWATNKGKVYQNTGKLFDVVPFIPRTRKNEERKASVKDKDKLEAWFLTQEENGRNNALYRYGCVLLESGKSLVDIQNMTIELNNKFKEPLLEEELNNTVLKSLATKVVNNGK